MIDKLRELAIAELKTRAAECDGLCGLPEDECYARHPVVVSALRFGDVLAVDAEIPALVDIVFSAIGLSCTGDGKHIYLSTSCLHGDCEYCQSNTGLCGNKTPASCKFCGSLCVHDCHGKRE